MTNRGPCSHDPRVPTILESKSIHRIGLPFCSFVMLTRIITKRIQCYSDSLVPVLLRCLHSVVLGIRTLLSQRYIFLSCRGLQSIPTRNTWWRKSLSTLTNSLHYWSLCWEESSLTTDDKLESCTESNLDVHFDTWDQSTFFPPV